MDRILYETELFSLWCDLSQFVDETCKDRDPSHGYEHMEEVVKKTFIILKELDITDIQMTKDAMMAAWLHDVNDHKYDKDGTLKNKVLEFLQSHSQNPTLIMDIIDRISYSKEDQTIKNKQNLDWIKVIGE